MCYEKIGGRSSLGPRSTTVGPRRPRVCVFRIPAFLEATVDPRQVRDNSGSRKPPEGLLWVPVVSASTLGPGAEAGRAPANLGPRSQLVRNRNTNLFFNVCFERAVNTPSFSLS